MKSAIVVGGGIAGLLAAKMLAQRSFRVTLVERDKTCGGLMGSVTNEDGVAFDYGAHVLSETGVAEVDDLLFGDLDPARWRSFNVLRAGNWFGGRMNRDSPFPDARTLGEAEFARAMEELAGVAAQSHPAPAANLQEALERRFGPTLADLVAAPTLKKQLRFDPADLHPETPFAIRRVVCGDSEQSRLLKQDERFSEPVAFASYNEGAGGLRHFYPRAGGIGQWIDGFVAGLQDDGVKVLCGETVSEVRHAGGSIDGVTLSDGDEMGCDLLAWTLPCAMLLRAAAIPFQGKPPAACPIGLYHLVFDRPFEDRNYHVTCYDDDFDIFRVTLYPNLRDAAEDPPFNCTVEVVGDADTDFDSLQPGVITELAKLGVTSPRSQLLSCAFHRVPVGFPATTPDFMAANASQVSLASAQLENALLMGRACCPPFFTPDVLRAVAEKIEGL